MRKFSGGLLAAAAWAAIAGPAQAGGLERGGYSIDLLFNPSKFAIASTGTWVVSQRTLRNIVDTNPGNGTLEGSSDRVENSPVYFLPRIGFKASLGDAADCMADYSTPWGAHTRPGPDWAGANQDIETKIYSHAWSATCSYRLGVGPGQFRMIGGVSYQEVGGFQERLAAPIPKEWGSGIGRLDVKGSGWGWRAGAAYEIPEIAFRASLVYHSPVKFGNLRGTLDLSQVPSAIDPSNPLFGQITPIYGSASMPAVAELNLQSGIAPGWLAFGSVKWADWSTLKSVPFCPVATRDIPCSAAGPTRATSLDLLFRDGWTVTAGVGREFAAGLSAAFALTWDRGTSTGIGTQTDAWLASAGVSYEPSEHIQLRIGGTAGILSAGSSGAVIHDGVTYGSEVSYDFGNDFVSALNASFRLVF